MTSRRQRTSQPVSRTALLCACAALAMAWGACSQRDTDDTASAGIGGSAASSSATTMSSSTGQGLGGYGGGAPHPDNPAACPSWRPFQGEACSYELLSLACRYASGCEPVGCEARCIVGQWVVGCADCSQPLPSCPAQAPQHGAACTAQMGAYWCFYDDCAANNDVAWGRCEKGSWQVNHSLCWGVGCFGYGGEDPPQCWGNTLCVEPSESPDCTPHPLWHCPLNPCANEPLSCACAGVVCGPFLDCLGVDGGWVTCGPKPPGPNDPVPLATDVDYPFDLEISDTHAYWTNLDGVHRVPIAGGSVEVLPSLEAYVLTIDVNYLYGGKYTGELWRLSLTSSTQELLASGLPMLQHMASNDQVVMWSTPTEIIEIPLSGGMPTSVVANGGPVELDASDLFFNYLGGPGLSKLPVSGGTPTVLTSEYAYRLALDASDVYFTQGAFSMNNDGKVLKVSKSGGMPVVLASNQYEPETVAVDATHVYFSRNDSFIMRVPKQGGTVETVVAGFGNPHLLALDATHLYFGAQLNKPCAGIWKVAK